MSTINRGALGAVLLLALAGCGGGGTMVTPQGDGGARDRLISDLAPPPSSFAVAITANPQRGPAPLEVAFASQTTQGTAPLQYTWDFGDRSASAEASPTHTFREPGVFTVTLQATDALDLKASGSLVVSVRDGAEGLTVIVLAAPDTGPAPLEVALAVSVVGGTEPYTYLWDLGHGQASTGAAPTSTYTEPGEWTVSVEVTDSEGNVGVGEALITVVGAGDPWVAIQATPFQGLAPLQVHFESSSGGGQPPYQYDWDFGDGATSRAGSPTHTFLGPGSYLVAVALTDETGRQASDSLSILATSPGELAVAIQADPQGGDAPLFVAFASTIAGGDPPFTARWTFGDGAVSMDSQPQHVYEAAGSYQASLTVQDAGGRKGDATLDITVGQPSGPLAVLAQRAPPQGQAPLIVTLTAQASGGAPPYLYLWDLGDGLSSIEREGVHMYTDPGDYTITLFAVDSTGAQATDEAIVTVTDASGPLAVRAEADVTEGKAPLFVRFQAVVSGGGPPYRFTWSFGDGSHSFEGTPSHLFLDPGTYMVTLAVEDGGAGRVEDDLTIVVSSPMEVTILAAPPSGPSPLDVALTAQVTGGVEPYGYSWSFGDGAFATGPAPQHIFFDPCSCLVELTVTDSASRQARGTMVVEALPTGQPLLAQATATPPRGVVPLEVLLEAHAVGGAPPYSYLWDLGDGGVSEQPALSHVYGAAGTYTAEAMVRDSVGAISRDSIIVSVASDDLPMAQAAATPTQGTAPLEVAFTATVQGGKGPYIYGWRFGDGEASAEGDPVHVYRTAGSFTALLEVRDARGATGRDEVVVVVGGEAPAVVLEARPDHGTAPLEVSFSANLVGGQAPFGLSWSFGDGTPPQETTDPETRHIYSAPGRYTVTVMVQDGADRMATDSMEVMVGSDEAPAVSAQATPSSGLAPLEVTFTGQVTGGDEPLSYRWELGDGTSSTAKNPTHTYTEAGTYRATLTVEDHDGDGASAGVDIAVGTDQVPTATAEASPTQGLAPLTVQLSGRVTGGNGPYSFIWTFRDGGTSLEQNPTHVFAFAGQYDVLFTVTDADGDQDGDTVTIAVGGAATLVASASAAPLSGLAPLTVSFAASMAGGLSPYSVSWDFGDGQAGQGQSVNHTYTRSGPHTVTLTATDGLGAQATDGVEIVVGTPQGLTALASASPTEGPAPLVVSFGAEASGGQPPYIFAWAFGDGGVAGERSPVHTYAYGGRYFVELSVTDQAGALARDSVVVEAGEPAEGCSVLEQGCPAGQKCTIGGEGLECAAAGALAEGQRCGTLGVDDCMEGLICAGDGLAYICLALCEPFNQRGCGPGEACLFFYPEVNAGYCHIYAYECGPLAQDCPSGQKCALGDRGIECVLAGTGGEGWPCGMMGWDDCAPGLLCVMYDAFNALCTPLCEPLAQPSGCGAGEECYLIVEGVNLGVCL